MAGRFFRRVLDKEPAVIIGASMGITGFLVGSLGPKIRYQLGYPVDQAYGMEDP